MGGGRSVPAGQQVEVDEREEIVERVVAIDVAKASGMVCTRVPHATGVGRRVTRVWQVPSTTNQVLELAELLAGEGIERVVVESPSDSWRPFVSVLEARGLVVWLVNARDARAPAGAAQDRQAGGGVVVQAAASGAGCGPRSSRLPRSAGCGRTPGCGPT
jgi:hypothetical protein